MVLSIHARSVSFKQEDNQVYNHIQSVHDGVKYPCTQCEYQASEKPNLYRHMNSIHHGINYPCSICDYKASFKDNLKNHIKKTVHREIN